MPNKPYSISRSLYQLPGMFFAPDDPGNGQQTASEDEKKAANANANGGGNAGTSQADLDRQFAERAKRAAEAERKRLLEALGVQDEDSLKAIIEAKRKADDEAKTELQKQADKAAAAEAQAAKLKAEADAQVAALRTRLLESEIKIAAAAAVTDKDGKVTRAAFRADALPAVIALIDRGEIAEEEGTYKGIDKALEKLAKAHAYMLEAVAPGNQPKGTPKSSGKQPPTNDDQETKPSSRFEGLEFESL